jgi:hypothetical protein
LGVLDDCLLQDHVTLATSHETLQSAADANTSWPLVASTWKESAWLDTFVTLPAALLQRSVHDKRHVSGSSQALLTA